LHLVGYLYYWQMGLNSVFKGLKRECLERTSLAFEHQSLDFWEELVTKNILFLYLSQ